jgi:hypothetical protein
MPSLAMLTLRRVTRLDILMERLKLYSDEGRGGASLKVNKEKGHCADISIYLCPTPVFANLARVNDVADRMTPAYSLVHHAI